MATPIFKRTFHNFLNKVVYIVGSEYYLPEFRFNIRSFCYAMGCATYPFAWVYTLIYGDLAINLNGLGIMAVWLQGTFKFMSYMICMKQLRLQYEYLHQFYRQCDENRTSSAVALKWANLFWGCVQIFCAFTIFMGVAFTFSPLLVYQLTGERESPLPVYVPFVDRTTITGYVQQLAYSVFLIFNACVGYIASELTLCLFVLHTCPMSLVFISKLEELEQHLENKDMCYGRVSQRYLYNLASLHRDMCNYIGKFELLRSWFFVEVFVDGLSMCLALFALFITNWMPLYSMMLFFVAKLAFSCGIGTVVEIYTERSTDALIRFKWYLLSVPDRKVYALMVHRAVTSNSIRAGVVPLNMELFIAVMRQTFNVAVFLKRMM